MADIQPPPTFADVILIDFQTKLPKFNPIWLKWFLDLAQILNAAGGSAIQHNDLAGMQGGSLTERYHLTAAQHSAVTSSAGNETPGGVIDGVNADFTLAHTPIANSVILVKTDIGTGVVMILGTHYTLATNTITFTAGNIPAVGQLIRAWYQY